MLHPTYLLPTLPVAAANRTIHPFQDLTHRKTTNRTPRSPPLVPPGVYVPPAEEEEGVAVSETEASAGAGGAGRRKLSRAARSVERKRSTRRQAA